MAETRAIEVVGDYPHNVIDFDRRFDSEEACTAYLVSLRWPQGFVCPACGGRRAWRRTRLAMLCASCRHEISIIAGTLFEKTHKPLQVVQGDVVGHEPEDGRQCSRTPTNPGAGQLRDGMA